MSPIPPALEQSEPYEMRIEMVSNPAYLCAVREMLGLVARRSGFPDNQAAKITLAVDEALANVMNHGYERRQDGKIWVTVYKLKNAVGDFDGMKIVIEDNGKQVDPSQIKSRDLADIRPGGLGVHIIREVMDSVLYEKRDGPGMRLTLVKRTLGTASDTTQATASDPCDCFKNKPQQGGLCG